MADELGEIGWYQPAVRALFPLSGIRTSKSLRGTIRRGIFAVRFDSCFDTVIRGCLRPAENWINDEIIRAYSEVADQGWGHCAECWQDGELVGGVYGIAIGGCFFAESMFHRRTDASKVALHALVDHCRALGFTVFDAQVMNPHLSSLGAIECPHRTYMSLLYDSLSVTTPWSYNYMDHTLPKRGG